MKLLTKRPLEWKGVFGNENIKMGGRKGYHIFYPKKFNRMGPQKCGDCFKKVNKLFKARSPL